MTFDRQAIYSQRLQSLIAMAKHPGCKAHAWHTARRLALDESGLFRGIDQDLKDAMTGRAEDLESVDPSQTKHL